MASPLENLSGPGKSLQKEPPDAKEFAGLKRSGLARLSDAANTANSLEGPGIAAYARLGAGSLARALFDKGDPLEAQTPWVGLVLQEKACHNS